jgi:minor extracellular serine protease Vpr
MKLNILFTVHFFFSISYYSFGQYNLKQIPEIGKKEVRQDTGAKVNRKGISPKTAELLSLLRKNRSISRNNPEVTSRKILLREQDGETYISALVKVNGIINEGLFSRYKVKIGTKAGNIMSIRLPLTELSEFINEVEFDYFQVDEPVFGKLDEALSATNVAQVHRGENLFLPVTGKDVIVGVVDFGFDYTHPVFFSEDGQDYRVKRVWVQNAVGASPAGFEYGLELTEEGEIQSYGYDVSISHGTHVTSIAASSGYLNQSYRGVAPESDLVLVTPERGGVNEIFETGQSNILDGVAYIFNYADQVKKPAVVNLSLGSHFGPHDGTSLFDQAVNALIGKGRMVVGAAGNEGQRKMFIQNNFAVQRSEFYTFIDPADFSLASYVDTWGVEGEEYCMRLFLVDPDGEILDRSEVFCTSDDEEQEFELFDPNLNLPANFYVYTSPSEFNNKPRVLIYQENFTGNHVLLGVQAEKGIVRMWNVGLGRGGDFVGAAQNEVIDGVNTTTVVEVGGTSPKIISVGAYTLKNNYGNLNGSTENVEGTVGNIAPFSSRGPTADGRIKPDITAPGNTVVAAVNSFDGFYGTNNQRVVDQVQENGKTYYYAAFEGTSMATPMVTGLVALMLEVNPLITPEETRGFLLNNSIVDNFTAATPNTVWGYGKMDALSTIQATALATGLSQNNPGKYNIIVYPNPSNGKVLIKGNSEKEEALNQLEYKLMDPRGRILSYGRPQFDHFDNYYLNFSHLKTGIYILLFTYEGKTETIRIILEK